MRSIGDAAAPALTGAPARSICCEASQSRCQGTGTLTRRHSLVAVSYASRCGHPGYHTPDSAVQPPGSTPGGTETRFQGANGPGTTQGLGTEAWRGVASSSTAWLDRIGCSKQHPWPTLLLCLLRNSDHRKGDCRHRSCMSLSYETHSAQPGLAWTCHPRTRRSSRCPGGCGALFLTVHCYFVGSRARPRVGSGRRHGEGRARPLIVRHSRWATAVLPWDPKP